MFDISQLATYREGNRIEAKKAKGGLPASLWPTYSAFANTYGGIIILGADEDANGKLLPAGLTHEEVLRIRKQFWDIVNNPQKVSENLLTDNDVNIEEYNGSWLLTILMPRAPRTSRPIYLNNDIFHFTYRRNDSGDYRCNRDEVRATIRDQSNETVDTKVIDRVNLSDLNAESIFAFRMNYKFTHDKHPWDDLNNEDFLKKLGAADISDTDRQLHPTGAGLLMFGNEYDIVREYPAFFLDYREMVNDITEWEDRIYSTTGDWSGNVFDFYRRIVTKLVQDLKTPLRIEGFTRIDDTPQHKAVREALANALCNADYYGTGGIVIKKHRDRLVFENPGTIRVGKEQLLAGGYSDPRNKVIHKIFGLLHIGERAGSGFNRIISAWQSTGWDAPVVEERIGQIERTILTLPLNSKTTTKTTQKTTTKTTQKLHRKTTQKTTQKTLSKGAQAVLNAMIVNPCVTTEEIAEALHISRDGVNYHIRNLKNLGLILRIGGDKGGHWQVNN